MTARRSGVVALVVTRGNTPFLETTLEALASQSLRPDRICVVDAGGGQPLPDPLPHLPPALTVVTHVPGARTLGDAVRRATQDPDSGPALAAARWWWLLHDDSAPEPDCLRELWDVADLGRTTAVVGPKQMSWDGAAVVEVGVDATRSARRLEAVAPGEIDQGQYDDRSDVLAVGTAGMLVERQVWEDLGGTDKLLGPFGDGLEFCRRVRRAGHRVVLAPRARVRHARRSLPDSFRARRAAQLANWFLAVPPWQVPLLVAGLVVWTPLRALARLLTGVPTLAPEEFGAWWDLIRSTPHLLASRVRAARSAVVPRSVLGPLETTPRALAAERRLVRRIRRTEGPTAPVDPLVLSSLRRHARRSRGALLALLAGTTLASLVLWARFLQGLDGAAWGAAPLRWGDLWTSAWSAWIPGGDGAPGPADPLLIPLSLVSAPFAAVGVGAGTTWTWLLVLSLPLSVATAWLMSGALTTSVPARSAGALAWASLPALTLSASQGRLGGVVVHILLPVVVWSLLRQVRRGPLLVSAGADGDVAAPTGGERVRSAALGSLALAGVVCAAPWLLLPALLGALVVLLLRHRRALAVVLGVVPALVLVAPTVVHQLRESGGWAALMTPGGPALAAGSPPSWQVLLGIPSAVTWHPWVWVLGVPTGLLLVIGVLVASRSGRAAPTVRLGLGVCVLFLLVALALGHVDVAYTPGTTPTGSATTVAHAWISPALSVSAVALLVACLCACDSPLPWDDLRHRPVRVLAWFVGACSVAALGLWGVPGPLRAASWDHVAPAAGPGVPAVSVQAQLSPRAGRVLVLTHEGGVVHARVLRGPGTLATDASAGTRLAELTALRAGEQDAAREDLARAVVALVEYPDEDTVGALSRHGIDTVLLPDVVSDQGRRTANALDRAPGVEKVGTTAAGDLWRVRPQDSLPARLSVQAPDSVTVIRSGWVRTSVHIEQSVSGTLVLAERADPGWRASVDGQPLTATEPDLGTWRQAFELPSGGHLVLDFRPWWLMPWRLASGVVLVGACLAALPLRRRR